MATVSASSSALPDEGGNQIGCNQHARIAFWDGGSTCRDSLQRAKPKGDVVTVMAPSRPTHPASKPVDVGLICARHGARRGAQNGAIRAVSSGGDSPGRAPCAAEHALVRLGLMREAIMGHQQQSSGCSGPSRPDEGGNQGSSTAIISSSHQQQSSAVISSHQQSSAETHPLGGYVGGRGARLGARRRARLCDRGVAVVDSGGVGCR